MQANAPAPNGYAALAQQMSEIPEFTILRRFDDLSALRLLRLQAELLNLKEELRIIQQENNESKDDNMKCLSIDFYLLLRAGPDDRQLILLDKIGAKLAEYYSALQQAAHIQAVKSPSTRNLKSLRFWLEDPKGGDLFLRGWESDTYEAVDKDSYLTLLDESGDVFSESISAGFVYLYEGFMTILGRRKQTMLAKRRRDRAVVTRLEALGFFSVTLAVVLSSVMLTASIIALYYVRRLVTRLGLIVLFTTLFSVLLSICTSADRTSIFQMTTAFAAVEVVFVGSTSTSTNGTTF